MRYLKLWACAATLALMAGAPVFVAQPAQAQSAIQKVEKKPKPSKPKTRAVPGPVAGIGLPVAVIAGGYVWLRKRRRNRAGSDQS